jgi:hypothetical protein
MSRIVEICAGAGWMKSHLLIVIVVYHIKQVEIGGLLGVTEEVLVGTRRRSCSFLAYFYFHERFAIRMGGCLDIPSCSVVIIQPGGKHACSLCLPVQLPLCKLLLVLAKRSAQQGWAILQEFQKT